MLSRTRWLLPLLAAAPAAAVAVTGLFHPELLTPDTAERWRLVHYVLLPLFPLVGAPVWLLLLGRGGALAWTARGLVAVYGLLYTALDSIAGIGGGHQMARTAARVDPRPPVEDLFDAGDPLGHAGVVVLAVAFLVTAGLLWRTSRSLLAVGGGALAALSCTWFLQHHVFAPRGVLALAGIAVGLALMGVAAGSRGPVPAPARR